MFQQGIPRSFLWLVSLFGALIIGIIGCGGDDNEWVGTWATESISGESLEQLFAEEFGDTEIGFELTITANQWTFNNDGTMEMELAMKFELKEQGIALSVESSMKMTGTYFLADNTYTLTFTEAEGTGLFEEEVETGEDTGTWSRSGNTLTLHSDDSSTVVLKRE